MSVLSVFTQTLTRPSWSVDSLPSLSDKIAIVTGASAGLGKITALELARKGAHVFCVGRSFAKTQAVIDEIVKETGNPKVELLLADFMDLVSVEAAADAFLARGLKLDILVNNAGIMYVPLSLSKQGIESQFATNHFATVVFTMRLLPALKKAPSARIVNLSSIAHVTAYYSGILYDHLNPTPASFNTKARYGETKLANIHFTRELQRRLEAVGINSIYVNAVHPGIVKTELLTHTGDDHFSWSPTGLFVRAVEISPQNGALTQLFVAADPAIVEKQHRGQFFVPYATLGNPSLNGRNNALALKTWEWTEQVLRTHFRSDWSAAI